MKSDARRRAPVVQTVLARLYPQRLRLGALFAGILAPLLLFGVLAQEIRERSAMAFDEAVLLFMHRHASQQLDGFMLILSTAGSGRWVGALDIAVCAILLLRRRWIDAIYWSLATGGAALLNQLAKHLFARTRPDLWPSLAPEVSFSFPSGHAMQSMAFAAALTVLLWYSPARWPALLLGALFTLLVGASRIYLGVHFPSDVLGGWAASLAWVIGLSFLFRKP